MASTRKLHFTAQGFKSQVIDIATNSEDPSSKRIQSINQETEVLDDNLSQLDDGTKLRNRTFQDRLDEIWGMTSSWEAKLKTESIESVESITHIRVSL